MPRAKVSDTLELEYDVTGDAGAPPLLLVMGFGQQMIAWDPRFCAKIADKGFRVVRFDNRDVGLSTKLAQHGTPDFMRAMMGDASAAPYSIADMADDSRGPLDRARRARRPPRGRIDGRVHRAGSSDPPPGARA